MRRKPGIMVAGCALLVAGGWLIAGGLGVPLLPFWRVWPLVPVAIGLALVAQHTGEPGGGRGLLLLGLPVLLVGLFLLAFTLEVGGLAWADMRRFWPVFPLILGITFMMVYISGDMVEPPLLVLAYLFGGVGLAALPFTLGTIRLPVGEQVARFWPVLVGLVVLLAALGVWRLSRRVDGRQARR
ncbi:MAG TPA: hypothetical protein PK607_04225 [Aggregatilineales bacterium]|nr:hypothetical protein [Aggregatilineales bacterium]